MRCTALGDLMGGLGRLAPQWSTISLLLDEALDLPASERAGWLANLAGEHADLRETLDALLGSHAGAETENFLGELPRLGGRPALDPAGGPAPGGQVGPYRLVAEIGRGGMGTVWLAERADGLMRRRVALKLPRIVWGGDFAERLHRERQILAALEHPNIARLYDAGLDAQERPYLAMEYVEGEPIDRYCRSRMLSLRERIALLLQVASAVSHAHSKLVVHRDLKPGNILVAHDGQAKLLDFGIAKLLEGERTERSILTELSGRALTLDYASPEQIRGEPLGTGSDVYSLGIVAYELLACARPYRLKHGGQAEIEHAIASTEPQLASVAAADVTLARQLRGDLDAILNKALKKAVDERYRSVDAFADDLERHLRGEPVQARPDSRRYRIGKFVRRHRLAVAMGSALAVSIVGGTAVSVWQALVANEHAKRAETEAISQRAVRDMYIDAMMQLGVLGVEQPAALGRPHAASRALRDALAAIEPRVHDRPVAREAQLEAVMLQLNYDGDFEGSLAVGREYLGMLQSHGGESDRVIEAYGTLGRTLYQLKRFDESEAMRRAGVNWAPDKADTRTVMARLTVISDLGGILAARGKRSEAQALLHRGEALAARAFPGTVTYTEIPYKLSILDIGFDDARALREAEAGHAAQIEDNTSDAEQRAYGQLHLGNALQSNGRAAEAEAAYRTALSITTSSYGRESKNEVLAACRVAGAISRQGDYARAAEFLADERRALAGAPPAIKRFAELQLLGRELDNDWLAGDTTRAAMLPMAQTSTLVSGGALIDNLFLLHSDARLLVLAGRADEAVQLLRTMQHNWAEPEPATLAAIRTSELLAIAQLSAGDAQGAKATANALSALLEQQDARNGRAYRVATEITAQAAGRLGDRAAAARALALADAQISLPPFPSSVERAESSLRRAEILTALGRSDEARAAGRAAAADLEGQRPDSPRLQRARHFAAPDVTSSR